MKSKKRFSPLASKPVQQVHPKPFNELLTAAEKLLTPGGDIDINKCTREMSRLQLDEEMKALQYRVDELKAKIVQAQNSLNPLEAEAARKKNSIQEFDKMIEERRVKLTELTDAYSILLENNRRESSMAHCTIFFWFSDL